MNEEANKLLKSAQSKTDAIETERDNEFAEREWKNFAFSFFIKAKTKNCWFIYRMSRVT